MKTKKSVLIMSVVVSACIVMGCVDAIIQPGYVVKSAIKILLFLLLPMAYVVYDRKCDLKSLFIPKKKGLLLAFLMGIGVYGAILTAYFLFRNVFDFSALTKNLTETTGVNKENFLYVALYISFVNSLLEEFFFRGVAFLTLKKVSSAKLAYMFSAAAFALYHIAMMIGWFDFVVVLLALVGLFIGGLIFNYFNQKEETIYLSWLIHMFANFATNTIGFLLFSAQ